MCKDKINPLSLTLKIYSGYLQENEIKMASNRFLSTLKFCPVCLREDKAYFRKHWKLTFVTACSIHKCYLYDSCPQCKSKLSILKMHHNELGFAFCSICGFQFQKAKEQTIPKKYFDGLNQQNNFLKILEKGYVQYQQHIVYSFCLFDTVIQLTKILLIQKNILFIHKDPLFRLLEDACSKKYNTSKSTYLQLSTIENYALFGIIGFLFERYPQNMKKYIMLNNKTYGNMIREIKYLSFWYDNLINDIVPRYIAFGDFVTKEEVENGIEYLKSQHKDITKANLSRLFENISHFAKHTYNMELM